MFKFLKEKIRQIASKFKKKVEEDIKIEVPEELEEEFSSPEYEAVVKEEGVEIIEDRKIDLEEVEKEERKAVEEYTLQDDMEVEESEPAEFKAPEKEQPGAVMEAVPPEKGEADSEEEKKEGLLAKVVRAVAGKVIEEEDLEDIGRELELALIEADVAVEAAERIVDEVKKKIVGRRLTKGEAEKELRNALKGAVERILDIPHPDLLEEIADSEKPYLILLVGFNGVGKTTTVAKLARYLMENGFSVALAAADTFRSAAIEQLEEHGKRIEAKVVKKEYGHDPAAVVYDAVQYARRMGVDVVIGDTAGRSHSNRNLMDELEKVIRVNKPNKVFLVIDSITGNDAVIQAEQFSSIRVDGIILTKMDVNEKGGAAISVAYLTGKPIYFICTGQEYGDFEEFDARKMAERMFEE